MYSGRFLLVRSAFKVFGFSVLERGACLVLGL